MKQRANLGCGNKYKDGWLNLDLYAPTADLQADLRTCTLPANHFQELLLIHVLEHLPYAEGQELLRRMYAWLAPGGRVAIEVPDADKCQVLIETGQRRQRPDLRLRGLKGLLGGRGQDKEGWHAWLLEHEAQILQDLQQGATIPAYEVPEKWRSSGEPHCCAWTALEVMDALLRIGYVGVRTTDPEEKGAPDRDSRVEARKPKR